MYKKIKTEREDEKHSEKEPFKMQEREKEDEKHREKEPFKMKERERRKAQRKGTVEDEREKASLCLGLMVTVNSRHLRWEE